MRTVAIPQLTFTRFLAAISVVVFHYGQDALPFRSGFLHSVAHEAGITVSYFFFLSGFLLYHVYGNRKFSSRDFFVARAARILPLYFFAFVVSLYCVFSLLEQKPWGGTVVLQFFMLQAWFPGNALSINYPAWSISVEVFFYALFPLLLYLSRRTGQKKFMVFAVALWLLSIVQNYVVQKLCFNAESQAAGDFIMYFPVWHLNAFVFGMAASMICSRIDAQKIPKYLPPVVLFGAVAMILAIITSHSFLHSVMHTGLLSPLYALIVLAITADRTIIAKSFSWSPFVFIGEISYGIYLLQYPVWVFLGVFFGEEFLKTTSGFYFGLAALVGCSALVYVLVERPARKYIRKRWSLSSAENP